MALNSRTLLQRGCARSVAVPEISLRRKSSFKGRQRSSKRSIYNQVVTTLTETAVLRIEDDDAYDTMKSDGNAHPGLALGSNVVPLTSTYWTGSCQVVTTKVQEAISNEEVVVGSDVVHQGKVDQHLATRETRPNSPGSEDPGKPKTLDTLDWGREAHWGFDRHGHVRTYMEDFNSVVPSWSLEGMAAAGQYMAIYDGHNGKNAASAVKGRLRSQLEQNLSSGLGPQVLDDLSQYDVSIMSQSVRDAAISAISNAYTEVDQELTQEFLDRYEKSGCTALTMMKIGRNLFTANIGDTRAVLSRDGCSIRLSEDHTPELLSERERIEKIGGLVQPAPNGRALRVYPDPSYLRRYMPGTHPPGLTVTRAFGDWLLKNPKAPLLIPTPHINITSLIPEDQLLILASDGVWGVMDDQEVVDLARLVAARLVHELSGEKLAEKIALELREEAQRRGSTDNITVLIGLLNWQ